MLQSICNGFRRKPDKESYVHKKSISMNSSIRGSTRASNVLRSKRGSKFKDSFSIRGSYISPDSRENITRKTIYIDDNNNIIYGGTASSNMSKPFYFYNLLMFLHLDMSQKQQQQQKVSTSSSNRPNNLVGVVFENNKYNQQMVFDEKTSFMNVSHPYNLIFE